MRTDFAAASGCRAAAQPASTPRRSARPRRRARTGEGTRDSRRSTARSRVAPLQPRELPAGLVLGELELNLGEALAESDSARVISVALAVGKLGEPQPAALESGDLGELPLRLLEAADPPPRRAPSAPRRRRSASARRWCARAAGSRPPARGPRSAGSPRTARGVATRRPPRRTHGSPPLCSTRILRTSSIRRTYQV